jgi:hypothetical protein
MMKYHARLSHAGPGSILKPIPLPEDSSETDSKGPALDAQPPKAAAVARAMKPIAKPAFSDFLLIVSFFIVFIFIAIVSFPKSSLAALGGILKP